MIVDPVPSGFDRGFDSPRRADEPPEVAHLLLANFRSIVVRRVDRDVAAAAPARAPAGAIARWLLEYQHAYVAANQACHGHGVHHLRNRALTFSGDGHLSSPDDTLTIAEPALAAGMSLSLGITLDALSARSRELASLRERVPSLAVTVDCSLLDAPRSQEALRQVHAALGEHVGRGGEVCLTGDIAALRAIGVFASEMANRSFVQIHAPLRHGLRPVHRRHDFAPCQPFFALTIDDQGDVYPCSGMLGHPPGRLGSIHEPFEGLLRALSERRVRIESLGRSGPRIEAENVVYPADLCALHRAAVSELTGF